MSRRVVRKLNSVRIMEDSRRELRSNGSTYQILQVLGEGQSATVFKAIRKDQHGHSVQHVALKKLKSSAEISWLRREFETLVRVNSPFCGRVLGWESFESGPALVLEFIDGFNLYELCRDRQLSEELLNEIVAQVQEGLRALEACGLHHGDLSPKNILVDRDGAVRIVDFAASEISSGNKRGTPQYLAPEIWQGASTSLQADLFALGVIVHDVRSGFGVRSIDAPLPKELDACRARSFQLASEKGELLALNPNDRKMLSAFPRDDLKRELAQLVADEIGKRAVPTTVMLAYSGDGCVKTKLRRKAAAAAVVLFVTALPVLAQAPLENSNSRLANLVVRSHGWLGIWLNGRWIGYAPLRLKGLRAGAHRLSWRGASGSGETIVLLEPGANKVLSATEFRRRPMAKGR